MPTVRSILSAESRTVIPTPIRERLGLKPGDRLVYRVTPSGVVIDRDSDEPDPFVAFSEWATAEEDEAWRDL